MRGRYAAVFLGGGCKGGVAPACAAVAAAERWRQHWQQSLCPRACHTPRDLPAQVIRNGSFSMHAVGDAGASVRSTGCSGSSGGGSRKGGVGGAAFGGGGGGGGACWVLRVRTLDCALVSPGAPTGLPNVVSPPDMAEGVAFNLVNNLWCGGAGLGRLRADHIATRRGLLGVLYQVHCRMSACACAWVVTSVNESVRTCVFAFKLFEPARA